jgi:hypothetical protein
VSRQRDDEDEGEKVEGVGQQRVEQQGVFLGERRSAGRGEWRQGPGECVGGNDEHRKGEEEVGDLPPVVLFQEAHTPMLALKSWVDRQGADSELVAELSLLPRQTTDVLLGRGKRRPAQRGEGKGGMKDIGKCSHERDAQRGEDGPETAPPRLRRPQSAEGVCENEHHIEDPIRASQRGERETQRCCKDLVTVEREHPAVGEKSEEGLGVD